MDEMTVDEELKNLSKKAFSLIELVEVLNIPESSFNLIRKKLLNLGNDIRRVSERLGDNNG